MAAQRRIGPWHGGDQPLSVSVPRIAEHGSARADFDNFAKMHHRYAMADALDHRHAAHLTEYGQLKAPCPVVARGCIL
jgi:hypothetical protein